MDERISLAKTGHPIPEWDLRHRLPINMLVGPQCKDTATIFRINSTFMDVTDQPFMNRQWLGGGALTACLGASAAMTTSILIYLHPHPNGGGAVAVLWLLLLAAIIGFGYTAWRLGRDEFISLTRRPIRFNRKQKKIYAIRQRRFFAKRDEGDVTWEAPWNDESIFCIHRTKTAGVPAYHIKHYTVDSHGNVVRAFSIGREWEGQNNFCNLLSQWNFWCEYMNDGPANLPKPPLFFSEHESLRETFFFCFYDGGFSSGVIFRIIMLPMTLMFTICRLLGQWTSREPVWPAAVEAISAVAADDPFSQPGNDTPVGWGDTALATAQDKWPADPKKDIANWHGEKDNVKNAALWAADVPPATTCPP